jgi:OmcA/MtrC family decaheme c-type cytochrome
VSYRTDGRFGFRRRPGDALQAVFPPAGADSDDVGVAEGDWKGLPLVDGTYKVGAWANRDFSVLPLHTLAPSVKAWNDIATDLTTYRMISPPATKTFQFGAATQTVLREVIADGACDRCHGDLQAHGFGRRGYETCELCHLIPGYEDGQKSRFATWYTGFTPNTSMDFRSLLHKVHMGREAQGSTYEVIGVFLGVPYPVTYEQVGFPAMPGGPMKCLSCHEDNSAWRSPVARTHQAAGSATRAWAVACGSCHDTVPVAAHMYTQTTSTGQEACAVCHGPADELSVERVHRAR